MYNFYPNTYYIIVSYILFGEKDDARTNRRRRGTHNIHCTRPSTHTLKHVIILRSTIGPVLTVNDEPNFLIGVSVFFFHFLIEKSTKRYVRVTRDRVFVFKIHAGYLSVYNIIPVQRLYRVALYYTG